MKIGVLGAAGRMGRLIAADLWAREQAGAGVSLAGLGLRAGDTRNGQTAAEALQLMGCPVTVSDDPAAVFAAADVVIDFTLPEATERHLALAVETATPVVIGTTGLSAAQEAALDQAAKSIGVILAANTSLGVNLLLDTVRRVAGALPASKFDIEIVEMHHGRKLDAPSGTALALGRAAAAGRGVKLGDVQRLSREGHTGARPEGEIGFATLRGGDVVGEHTVIFAAQGERIEITHRCTDRAIFARGAVEAALWLAKAGAGRHQMADVLGV
jgi:4-hydroxy-tetrahydrodipicolinate reductase